MLLLGLAACLYVGFALFSIGKPLQLDEALPVAWNAGGIERFGFDALGRAVEPYEISHPTLHQHVLALDFEWFGESAVSARALGAVAFLASFFLLLALARRLWEEPRASLTAGVAALLYAANPLCLQQSIVVDSETSLLPLGLLWLCLALVSRPPLASPGRLLGTSAIFAFALWCKEFPPWFLLAAWVVGAAAAGRLRRGLVEALLVGGLGLGLFALSWWLYCRTTGLAPLAFVEFSVLGKALTPGYYRERSLAHAAYAFVALTGRWGLPAFFALVGVAALRHVARRLRRDEPPSALDFLWSGVAIYAAVAFGVFYAIPRYQFPLYGLAALLAADLVVSATAVLGGRRLALALVGAALVGVGLFLVADDPVLLPWRAYLVVGVLVPLGAGLLFDVVSRGRAPAWAAGVGVLLCWLAAGSVHLNLEQTAPHNTSASWGTYGERGLAECLDYLDEVVRDETVVARKDLLYALGVRRGRRELPSASNVVFRGDLADPQRSAEATRLLAREDVAYVVLDPESHPQEAARFLAGASPAWRSTRRCGDFEVFTRVAPPRSARPALP